MWATVVIFDDLMGVCELRLCAWMRVIPTPNARAFRHVNCILPSTVHSARNVSAIAFGRKWHWDGEHTIDAGPHENADCKQLPNWSWFAEGFYVLHLDFAQITINRDVLVLHWIDDDFIHRVTRMQRASYSVGRVRVEVREYVLVSVDIIQWFFVSFSMRLFYNFTSSSSMKCNDNQTLLPYVRHRMRGLKERMKDTSANDTHSSVCVERPSGRHRRRWRKLKATEIGRLTLQITFHRAVVVVVVGRLDGVGRVSSGAPFKVDSILRNRTENTTAAFITVYIWFVRVARTHRHTSSSWLAMFASAV